MKLNKIPLIELKVTLDNYTELNKTIDTLHKINAISEIEHAVISLRLYNIYLDLTLAEAK